MVFIGGCNYEVLINDFPVDRYYGDGNGAASGSVPINRAILNSGKQTWKIRIYPVHDKEEINGKIAMVARPAIQEGARIELSIEGIRFKEDGGIEKRFGKVVNFETSLKKDDKKGKTILAESGKPCIENKGSFDTQVPYNLQGWRNSEDLTKIDKTSLTKSLLLKYKQFPKWIDN